MKAIALLLVLLSTPSAVFAAEPTHAEVVLGSLRDLERFQKRRANRAAGIFIEAKVLATMGLAARPSEQSANFPKYQKLYSFYEEEEIKKQKSMGSFEAWQTMQISNLEAQFAKKAQRKILGMKGRFLIGNWKRDTDSYFFDSERYLSPWEVERATLVVQDGIFLQLEDGSRHAFVGEGGSFGGPDARLFLQNHYRKLGAERSAYPDFEYGGYLRNMNGESDLVEIYRVLEILRQAKSQADCVRMLAQEKGIYEKAYSASPKVDVPDPIPIAKPRATAPFLHERQFPSNAREDEPFYLRKLYEISADPAHSIPLYFELASEKDVMGRSTQLETLAPGKSKIRVNTAEPQRAEHGFLHVPAPSGHLLSELHLASQSGKLLVPGTDYTVFHNPKVGSYYVVLNSQGDPVHLSAGFVPGKSPVWLKDSDFEIENSHLDEEIALMKKAGLIALARELERVKAGSNRVQLRDIAKVMTKAARYSFQPGKPSVLDETNPYSQLTKFVDELGRLNFQCNGADFLTRILFGRLSKRVPDLTVEARPCLLVSSGVIMGKDYHVRNAIGVRGTDYLLDNTPTETDPRPVDKTQVPPSQDSRLGAREIRRRVVALQKNSEFVSASRESRDIKEPFSRAFALGNIAADYLEERVGFPETRERLQRLFATEEVVHDYKTEAELRVFLATWAAHDRAMMRNFVARSRDGVTTGYAHYGNPIFVGEVDCLLAEIVNLAPLQVRVVTGGTGPVCNAWNVMGR